MKQDGKAAEEISASATRYYDHDCLTDEEIAEDRAWGDVAARQWVDRTRSDSL
jgi:hypothetical protein